MRVQYSAFAIISMVKKASEDFLFVFEFLMVLVQLINESERPSDVDTCCDGPGIMRECEGGKDGEKSYENHRDTFAFKNQQLTQSQDSHENAFNGLTKA